LIRGVSLRSHLAAAIGLTVALCVGLTLLVGALLTRREVEHATLAGVSRQADLLAQSERAQLFSRIPELRPILARQHERVIFPFPSLNRPWRLPHWTVARLLHGRPADGKVDGEFFAARNVNGRAFILLRQNRVAAASRPFLEGLLLSTLAGAALAALVAAALSRRIARSLRRVARATRAVAAGRAHDPVPEEGARELASLARSFNDMSAQLERARAIERSFLLSVSHELKTPLTAIRGYAEGVADGALDPGEAAATIVHESARLERLVGDLLDLARMNTSRFSIHREPIDLAETAREAERRYAAQAREFGVRLETLVVEPAGAIGDADRALQIASNLVENALRLTPRDGRVRIVAAPGLLAVEDTGPGLKPEELPHAFERFYLHSRYGGERPVGTGLGLALVKELAEGMGGSVSVESAPGTATSFVVRLDAFYEGFTSDEPTADGSWERSSPQPRQEVPT
jgi:two-component system sensor histidine kinase BaeS